MPSFRLYFDHDSLNHAVVDALRVEGLDILTTVEAGHQLLEDREHLEFATVTGRVLYSANRRDFAQLHGDWMAAARPHQGIILRARQDLSIGEQIRGILLLQHTTEFESMTDRLEYMESWLRRFPR